MGYITWGNAFINQIKLIFQILKYKNLEYKFYFYQN